MTKTLGQWWQELVPPTWDETDPDGRHHYVLGQNTLEERAHELFEDWKRNVVPLRLGEAMRNGEQFHGFQTQAWLLATDAFSAFRQWLAAEDLICNCVYPSADDADFAQGENVILMILPRTAEYRLG